MLAAACTSEPLALPLKIQPFPNPTLFSSHYCSAASMSYLATISHPPAHQPSSPCIRRCKLATNRMFTLGQLGAAAAAAQAGRNTRSRGAGGVARRQGGSACRLMYGACSVHALRGSCSWEAASCAAGHTLQRSLQRTLNKAIWVQFFWGGMK